MLPIGIVSTAYFDYDDYRTGLAELKADGFDCIDYQGFMHGDEMLYAVSEERQREYLADLYKCASDSGVRVNQMHALWPPEIDTPKRMAQSDEKLRAAVRGAALLHCPNLVVHPYLPHGWSGDCDPESTRETNLAMLGMLCSYAADFGVRICVENLPFPAVPIAKTSEVVRLVRDAGAKNIGVCLDVGHAHVMREEIGESVRLAGSYLAALHVHDNNGHCDSHNIPWQGGVDWDSFACALREIRFGGCISLETDFNHAMNKSLRADMRRVLARLASEISAKASERMP